MHPYLISLAQEYVDLIDDMRSGSYTVEEIHQLDSQRQTTHLELCRITGKSHSDDGMYSYARAILLAARAGDYQ